MDFTELTVGSDDSGRRLDHILMPLLASQSRNSVFAALRKGLIKLNGTKTNPQIIVQNGDRLRIATVLLKPENQEKDPFFIPEDTFETVFCNEHVRIINKPCGISVQPASQQEASVADIIARAYKKAEHASLAFTPAPLHRLDRNTSGLLVISQSLRGATEVSRMIEQHLIQKTYIGIATGNLTQKEDWCDCIDDSHATPPLYTVTVSRDGTAGKQAVTKAIPLCTNGNKSLTLIQYDIQTGRKHQIRAQSAFHGHALAGDSAYGAVPFSEATFPAFFLHAVRLRFDPCNSIGLPEEVVCEIPKQFKNFLKNNLLNWDGKLIL